MSEAPSASSEVEVAVDPDTAFRAFTEEMDLWWVRGPINFWSDAHRVVEVRCEPGVGGRIMEVLDRPDSDEVWVLARLTGWEPPRRLSWESEHDDVSTEVSFTATERGTLVRVVHTVAEDGDDHGGSFWSRVVPRWFGAWVERRDLVPHEVADVGRVAIEVRYAAPVAAARFLASAFGLGSLDDLPDHEHDPTVGHGHHWIELRAGDALVIVLPLDGERLGAPTHIPWIFVDDLDERYRRARDAGAVITAEPHTGPGGLGFEAADPEGTRWRFLQARPTQRHGPA